MLSCRASSSDPRLSLLPLPIILPLPFEFFLAFHPLSRLPSCRARGARLSLSRPRHAFADTSVYNLSLQDPFVSTVPARPPPPTPPPPLRPQPGTQPSCARRVLRSARSARSGTRLCRRTYAIRARIRRLLRGRVRFSRCRFCALAGFHASARTDGCVIKPLWVQHGAESARPLSCGVSLPGPGEREAGGEQHAWPGPLR
ncbi:hypothetical protein DFH09DRAFT_1216042 [Mycena vulgaris]|nr:hypothetical protein DFH09DRAFT_1216042 [Mycena vulgaris]